jgi:clan AA aspartic protease
MGIFSVRVTLINPEDRGRRTEIDMLVDTGATYMLLPPDVVSFLALEIVEYRPGELASGERVTYGVGPVIARLDGREYPSVFVAGPEGCPALLGAITLDAFGLAADPVHQRLFPVVARI